MHHNNNDNNTSVNLWSNILYWRRATPTIDRKIEKNSSFPLKLFARKINHKRNIAAILLSQSNSWRLLSISGSWLVYLWPLFASTSTCDVACPATICLKFAWHFMETRDASEDDEEPLSSRLHIVQSQKQEITERGKSLKTGRYTGEPWPIGLSGKHDRKLQNWLMDPLVRL